MICGFHVANTPNILARHLRSSHNTEWVDYVVKYEHSGEWPLCVCGCAERLQWKKGGFGKYVFGHDQVRKQVELTPGWVINPFTSRDEFISSDADIEFFKLCIENDEKVTHDHGLKIAWVDVSGKSRLLIPSFKHLNKNLIFCIDNPTLNDFNLRVANVKLWCESNSYCVLFLSKSNNKAHFDTIDAYGWAFISDN